MSGTAVSPTSSFLTHAWDPSPAATLVRVAGAKWKGAYPLILDTGVYAAGASVTDVVRMLFS